LIGSSINFRSELEDLRRALLSMPSVVGADKVRVTADDGRRVAGTDGGQSQSWPQSNAEMGKLGNVGFSRTDKRAPKFKQQLASSEERTLIAAALSKSQRTARQMMPMEEEEAGNSNKRGIANQRTRRRRGRHANSSARR
jgi:hypothetical protein